MSKQKNLPRLTQSILLTSSLSHLKFAVIKLQSIHLHRHLDKQIVTLKELYNKVKTANFTSISYKIKCPKMTST